MHAIKNSRISKHKCSNLRRKELFSILTKCTIICY